MTMKPIYVLYGSQTGNAEYIAQDMAEKAKEDGHPVECFELNRVKKEKMVLKNLASALVIVISTTGNGDAPENCEAFWRSIKLRSAAKDMFDGLPFNVLALGDTNYDKFCHMGKSVDKRVAELGGTRFMKLICADEGTGMEEAVEEWKENVLPTLKKFLVAAQDSTEKNKPNSDEADGEKGVASAEDNGGDVADTSAKTGDGEDMKGSPSYLPNNIETFDEVARRLGHAVVFEEDVPSGSLPRVPSNLKTVKTMELLHSETPSSSSSTSTAQTKEWTNDTPYNATLVGARWLTTPQSELAWEEEKRVIHMQVSLGNSGITYVPGDSIGICAPNPQPLVDLVLARLNDTEDSVGQPTLTRNTLVCGMAAESARLGELLEFKLDLVSVPKKAVVLALSQHCSDKAEARAMQWLSSKDPTGKALWGAYVEDQRVGVAEMLVLFPSCKPPLKVLLNLLPPQAPRYYSIASCPLSCPNAVTVAFSVVRYTCGASEEGRKIRRQGLCTSYLEGLLRPWLEAQSSKDPVAGAGTGTVFDFVSSDKAPTIRIWHKSSVDFHLPGSVTPPLILVGPGTGVAPFIGFLAQRTALEAVRGKDSCDEACTGTWRGCCDIDQNELPSESKTVVDDYVDSQEPGPISLFFGCRDERDFLYKKELESNLVIGTLTNLSVAFSRKAGEPKVYVQDRMMEKGSEIADLIINQGAYIYICGDGNHMAKDVYTAFQNLLVEHSSLDRERATDLLTELKLRRRYVMDIWS